MSGAAYVELPCPPAICRATGLADRSSADRLLHGHLAPPLLPLPDESAVDAPGRVHGLGPFTSEAAYAALIGALPGTLRAALRHSFEWYACRGAFFHTDAHFGEVLFGAWCVAGPTREIVFARTGLRVAAAAGDWVVFDPFEPHAVLDPGADRYRRDRYEGAAPSVFIGFELQLDEAVRRAFGIGGAPSAAPVLASSVAINAETGALP